MKTTLVGGPFKDPWYEQAWNIANARCLVNPNLVAISGIESGYPIVMTREEHKKFLEIFESFIPKTTLIPNGKLIMFGTGGDLDENWFNSMWEEGS